MQITLFSWQNGLDLGWFVFLLTVFWHFWAKRRLVLEMKHWPKTEARIVQCEWTMHGHHGWLDIEYTYQVKGHDFRGERLFSEAAPYNPSCAYARHAAYRVATAYKENQPVEAYYDPQAPERAVLDTHVPFKLHFIVGLLGVLVVFHVVSVIFRVLR